MTLVAHEELIRLDIMAEDPRIEYLVYKKEWTPEVGKPITELHAEPKIYVTVESFDREKHRGHSYCPTCGFPGTRKPLKENFMSNRTPAYLSHNGYPHVECPLKTPKALGKYYSSEFVRRRAIEDETLILIPNWSDGPLGRSLNNSGATYTGVTENPDSPIAGGSIGRYIGESYSLVSKSGSLTRIAQNPDKFLCRAIQLPDYPEPRLIREILIHVSDVTKEHDDASKLFWGRAKYVTSDQHYLRINFYHKTHQIAFWIPSQVAKQHRWTPESLWGRLVMVAGQLEPHKNYSSLNKESFQSSPIWRVRIEHWGETALISPKRASLVLEKNNENCEYTPEPDDPVASLGESDERVERRESECAPQSRSTHGSSRGTGSSAESTSADLRSIADGIIEKFRANNHILSRLSRENEQAGRITRDCPEANKLRLIADRFRRISDELQSQLEHFD